MNLASLRNTGCCTAQVRLEVVCSEPGSKDIDRAPVSTRVDCFASQAASGPSGKEHRFSEVRRMSRRQVKGQICAFRDCDGMHELPRNSGQQGRNLRQTNDQYIGRALPDLSRRQERRRRKG